MKKIKSFTLAEVLITLVIIGIIAAITIPMIMANHRRTEYSGKIKKFYANMNNAIKLAQIEEGVPIYEWKFNNYHELMDNYLGKYLNYIKIEDASDCLPGCTNVYLSDGTRFGFDCAQNFSNANDEICVIFDVNGEKGPNSWGRDFFQFGIWGAEGATKYNTTPLASDNYSYCDINIGGQGEDCSREALIEACKGEWTQCTDLLMMDGWEFKDDYPLKL